MYALLTTYLRTAFTPVAPKSVRIQSSCQYLFTLLGSIGAKAARKTLMKLSPGKEYDIQQQQRRPVEEHYVVVGCQKICQISFLDNFQLLLNVNFEWRDERERLGIYFDGFTSPFLFLSIPCCSEPSALDNRLIDCNTW